MLGYAAAQLRGNIDCGNYVNFVLSVMAFKVNPGGDVPQSYYRQNELADLTGFTEASISRGSSLQLDFVIDKANSVIRYVGSGFFFIWLSLVVVRCFTLYCEWLKHFLFNINRD